MTNKFHKAKRLLNRYRKGKSSEREQFILQKWYESLDFTSEMSDASADEETVGKKLEINILKRIKDSDSQSFHRQDRYAQFRKALASAAFWAVLILLSGVGFLYLKGPSDDGSLTRQQQHSFLNNSPTIKKIIMPDSTRVWLTANSRLTWDNSFSKKCRKVSLAGEAYFEVTKDSAHPFLVMTKNINIKVLGTAFDVEAYSWEKRTRVALLRGKVALSEKNESIPEKILHPGEVGSFTRGQRSFQIKKANVSSYVSWMDGKLDFTEVPLYDAVQRICIKYGYVIQNKTPLELNNKLVTVHFDSSENINDIISTILYINHIDFTIKHKQIIIK